jgi:ribonuclease HI
VCSQKVLEMSFSFFKSVPTKVPEDDDWRKSVPRPEVHVSVGTKICPADNVAGWGAFAGIGHKYNGVGPVVGEKQTHANTQTHTRAALSGLLFVVFKAEVGEKMTCYLQLASLVDSLTIHWAFWITHGWHRREKTRAIKKKVKHADLFKAIFNLTQKKKLDLSFTFVPVDVRYTPLYTATKRGRRLCLQLQREKKSKAEGWGERKENTFLPFEFVSLIPNLLTVAIEKTTDGKSLQGFLVEV